MQIPHLFKLKNMTCCSSKCQKWTLVSSALVCLLIGILTVTLWGVLVASIKRSELNVANANTKEFKLWVETPIPMYIDFYLFNWTNFDKYENGKKWPAKPVLEQVGPYVYTEKHYRKDIVFNANGTVTYKTQRIWHFAPDKSNGSESDLITTLNPILASVGNVVRNKNEIVQIGVNFFLNDKNVNLTVTKTALEFLFKGYQDPMIDLLHKLNVTAFNMPFDKFGWFYSRNESIDYDGIYNMFDGAADTSQLGRLYSWNYKATTGDYPGECGRIKGTSGELLYPVGDDTSIDVFSPDTCSILTLEHNGYVTLYDIKGNVYEGTARIFDNGTKYPDMGCYSYGERVPNGVRNVSACKYNAPVFVSYPHFYLADPYYASMIEGMKPNRSEHSFYMAVEPETGIPLQVQAGIQVNFRLMPVARIDLLKNVKEVFLPVMWFKQHAQLTKDLANQAKLLLILPTIGKWVGYAFVLISFCCLAAGMFIFWRNRSKGTDEEGLLHEG